MWKSLTIAVLKAGNFGDGQHRMSGVKRVNVVRYVTPRIGNKTFYCNLTQENWVYTYLSYSFPASSLRDTIRLSMTASSVLSVSTAYVEKLAMNSFHTP